jgi:hypothetical protein
MLHWCWGGRLLGCGVRLQVSQDMEVQSPERGLQGRRVEVREEGTLCGDMLRSECKLCVGGVQAVCVMQAVCVATC